MPAKNIISFDDAKLLVWEITESTDELFEELQNAGLNKIEYENISSKKRKLEYLSIRLALRSLLGKDVTIYYNADGKPFLYDESFHISISHSKKWITVMAHPTRPVGIDIECLNDKIKKLYKRFLNETEQLALSNGEDIRQLQLAWSAKEALYKIIGKQAVDFAQQLNIFPFEVKEKGQITAQHVPSNTFYNLYYIQTSAYTLVYCLA